MSRSSDFQVCSVKLKGKKFVLKIKTFEDEEGPVDDEISVQPGLRYKPSVINALIVGTPHTTVVISRNT
ncbi:hypothetical protein CEXT_484441 [Caerostris extrusa]|uniref:Uncharacterized protein n=1 Tax=Caerostris extrusa TaxID=172846 RepID=A0AAV4Y7M4_CAEEX|nr:hypothetical protein CEXT_484441 [Caerostris extrusa]